ncbi:MAG TPA: hypothetical protein VKC63_04455 [Solirubrobacterales bacterium]|nr:hypothetical protein [Solirubrobacterales bacterium]
MTTNLKAEARARMRRTGEKYTEARRGVLAERETVVRNRDAIQRVTIHTTHNGLPLAEDHCEAMTVRGRQCRNPFIYGQFWPGGHPEVVLRDGPETRMLAQRRCNVHVDHDRHAEVILVMDDVVPSRFTGPFPGPVWQDPRSLELIRSATSGHERADTLALYLTLTEHAGSADEAIEQQTGLASHQVEAAMKILTDVGLIREGMLVG